MIVFILFFFFQAEDGIRDYKVTGFRRVLFRSAVQGSQRDIDGADHPLGLSGPLSQSLLLVEQDCLAVEARVVERPPDFFERSEERRVGKEGRERWWVWREREKEQW